MPDDAKAEGVSLGSWLEGLHELLGDRAPTPITTEEQVALLDIARIAAHRSVRIAAPLSTFLAGAAYASLPPKERRGALQALVARLEG